MKNRVRLLRAGRFCLLAPVLAVAALASTTISGADGLSVSVDSTGSYEIAVSSPGWRFAGSLGVRPTDISVSSGTDAMGPFREVAFDFRSDAPRRASIRAYLLLKAVLFTLTAPEGAPNSLSFPSFGSYPANLGHLTYSGMFAFPWFYGFAPESPWVFFDGDANTFILSPVTDLMVTETNWGTNLELASGISPRIAALPAAFTHQTLLVIGNGINRTFDAWGQIMTGLHGKQRLANDADVTLERIGYWTDAGASYYYATEPSLSYAETLAGVKAGFEKSGIALGYIQLDSWFYPKGPAADWRDRASGIYDYSLDLSLFATTLERLQGALGVPLVTHSRWVDPASPYRARYRFSGDVSVDPLYWENLARYLSDAKVTVYEQDWLSDRAQTDFNLTDPEDYLDNMSSAMSRYGVHMQYCMPTTRHFLQGAKYSNLTSIRASEDRCIRGRWRNFVYASRLAGALGIWPFTDVFMSGEMDNLLLATLSAGPVGVGDPIGGLSAANLLQAVRPDGVIVKPDAPLVPLDSTFLKDSATREAPMAAYTYTDFGDLRAGYLLAWPQGANTRAEFRLSELGMSGKIYLYNYGDGSGRVVNADALLSESIPGSWLYEIAAPVGRSGIALVGDTGHFVTLGRKRVRSVTDDGTVCVTVSFAAGEHSRTLRGYSPAPPRVEATTGSAGALQYNPETGQFSVDVMPGGEGTASVRISQDADPAARTGTRDTR